MSWDNHPYSGEISQRDAENRNFFHNKLAVDSAESLGDVTTIREHLVRAISPLGRAEGGQKITDTGGWAGPLFLFLFFLFPLSQHFVRVA